MHVHAQPTSRHVQHAWSLTRDLGPAATTNAPSAATISRCSCPQAICRLICVLSQHCMGGRTMCPSARICESPTGTSTGLCRPVGNTCMHQSPAHTKDSQENCQPGMLMRDRVQQAAYPQRFALRWVDDAAAEAAAARCCAVLCGVQETQRQIGSIGIICTHDLQRLPQSNAASSKQTSLVSTSPNQRKRSILPHRST